MSTDPTDAELLSRYFEVMQAEPIHDLGALDERTAKALRAVYDAGRESVASATKEDAAYREFVESFCGAVNPRTSWKCTGSKGHEGNHRTPDGMGDYLDWPDEPKEEQ